jgi:endonuclease G
MLRFLLSPRGMTGEGDGPIFAAPSAKIGTFPVNGCDMSGACRACCDCCLRLAIHRAIASLVVFCQACAIGWGQAEVSEHLTLGNPSSAQSEAGDRENHLLVNNQFALSYNERRGIVNWVSWRLAADDLGNVPRSASFRADRRLPRTWFRARSLHYSGTGFDRGHVVPSADRTVDVRSNASTFLMTNVVPQSPRSNRQTWRRLEDYCRRLARSGNELYIVAGPLGRGGEGAAGRRREIAGRIAVPGATWKIVVVLPEAGGNDIHRISNETRVIAVLVPNRQTRLSRRWTDYLVTVEQLERRTGFDFLSELPGATQAALASKIDRLSRTRESRPPGRRG